MDNDIGQNYLLDQVMNFYRIIFQCVRRLKKLKNCLTSENSVEKNDEIFKEYKQNKIIEKVPFDDVPKKPGQVPVSPASTSTKGRQRNHQNTGCV